MSGFTHKKNKRSLLMPYDQISNLKTSTFSAASKSEHLKNEKKRTNSFPLSPKTNKCCKSNDFDYVYQNNMQIISE